MLIRRVSIAICASFAAIITSNGFAANEQAHMPTAGYTSQPIGHYEYCKSYIRDCNIKASNIKPPKLTREFWNDMVEINSYSNSTIEPVTDLEGYGTEELWVYPTSYGDCEDYVLMKRHMLMERGWTASALLVTVVRQLNGEAHAVLTVRTDRADYILDNLNNKILQWNETEYTYLKRQAAKHSGRWETIIDKDRKTNPALAKLD